MIKHILLFKFNPGIPEEKKEKGIQMLRDLKNKIPEIIDWEVGKQIKEVGDGRYDFAQASSFENEDAIKRYGDHPAHQEVRNYLKPRATWVKVDYKSMD